MDLAYYYAVGRYGDFLHKVGYTTTLRLAAGDYRQSEATTAAEMIDGLMVDLKRAAPNFKFALGLGMGVRGAPPWKDVLKAVAAEPAVMAQITAMELRDEPDWEEGYAKRQAEKARDFLAGLTLLVPTFGISLSGPQVERREAFIYNSGNGYDFVATQSYLEPHMDWDPVTAQTAIKELVRRQHKKLPRSVRHVVIGQSYDRNGAFGPPRALKALQHAQYEAAIEVDAAAIWWFAYGRPGGVVNYSGLVREHKAIAREEGIVV